MNSKEKGNNFERKTAKMLSDRFAEKTGITSAFKRNIDSGSFMGGNNQNRTTTHDMDKAEFGDIIAPRSFIYTIECKHYKSAPSFSQIMSQSCATLDEWIAKAEQDSKNASKKMSVIMKFNNVKEAVLLKQLFGDLASIMRYKEYHIVPLVDFLRQNDTYFFVEELPNEPKKNSPP